MTRALPHLNGEESRSDLPGPWSSRLRTRSTAYGHAIDFDDLLVLCRGREELPFDAVDVVIAREISRRGVLEAEVTELSGARRHLVDREIELRRAPHGVLAGDNGRRLDAQTRAVVADRRGEVGDGERDVETAHGRLPWIDRGHRSLQFSLVQEGHLYWYIFNHADDSREPAANAGRLPAHSSRSPLPGRPGDCGRREASHARAAPRRGCAGLRHEHHLVHLARTGARRLAFAAGAGWTGPDTGAHAGGTGLPVPARGKVRSCRSSEHQWHG